MSVSAGAPWRLLAVAGLLLYLLLPVRWAHGRWSAATTRADLTAVAASVIEDRAALAERTDVERLRADLEVVRAAMPVGEIEGWIDAVSGLAQGTGTTWRSATVSGTSAAAPGEPASTSIAIAVEGPPAGLLAFVDQLRVGTVRLTLVDEFAFGPEPGRSRRAVLSVKVRLLSFTASPAPQAVR